MSITLLIYLFICFFICVLLRRVRTIVVEPNVFSCISQLARALGSKLTAKIESLLDQMFSVGLSSGLTNALKVVAVHIPILQKNIQGYFKITCMVYKYFVSLHRWCTEDAFININASAAKASWSS